MAAASAPILGFRPAVELASVDTLASALSCDGSREIFVLPAALDFNLLQREALGRAIG